MDLKKKNSSNYRGQQAKLEHSRNKAAEALQTWYEDNDKSKMVYQFFSMRHDSAEFKLEVAEALLNKSTSTKYLQTMGIQIQFYEKTSWGEIAP